MTCKDCKFYENECESHAQMRMIGKERGMEICEIFCKAYVDCVECINFYECHYSGQLTGRLTSCPDFKQKPKTNADRIRAMTDEELAEMLYCEDSLGWCKNLPGCYRLLDTPDGVPEEKCKACLVKWLQQPAEGE